MVECWSHKPETKVRFLLSPPLPKQGDSVFIFEARFYSTGWAFRVWLLQLRWNSQDNYKGLSIELVKHSYFSSGGITWREFKLIKKQQKELAEAKRKEYEAKYPDGR